MQIKKTIITIEICEYKDKKILSLGIFKNNQLKANEWDLKDMDKSEILKIISKTVD